MADRRAQILDQCRSLMREVEIKQEFFLSDLDYEMRLKTDLMEQHLEEAGVTSVGLQSLQHFTQEVLKETDTCAFIQVGAHTREVLQCPLLCQLILGDYMIHIIACRYGKLEGSHSSFSILKLQYIVTNE